MVCVAALVAVWGQTPVLAATPAEVEGAIEKARAYLYGQQQPDGGWVEPDRKDKEKGKNFGGHTAMAVYALLASGENPQDPRVRKGIEWLATADISSTYALGMRSQVWTFMPLTPKVKELIARDYSLLLKGRDQKGRYAYSVKDTPGSGFFHNSTSQYGVLGVWACAQAGLTVPTEFWQRVEKGWQDCQSQEGAWAYLPTKPIGSDSEKQDGPRASMTAAGIATLFITQDYLHAMEGIRCQGNVTNPNIEAGLKWMSEQFNPEWGDGYLLYGIERIGVASGYKYFGKHDWYAAGAQTLVKSQNKDGSWSNYGPVPGTSFGLLFLSRGRAPVMMNKLKYVVELQKGKNKGTPVEGRWNQRPRDVANVVRWAAKQLERDLNWQIVNLDVPVEDLHDSPILYISGDSPLTFSDEHKQKLKTFVEQGGLIVAQADCGKAAFTRSAEQLGNELFKDYEFRPLPPEHPIYAGQQFMASSWRKRPQIRAKSNGVRELMILIGEEDPGRSWQMMDKRNNLQDFELAADIFFYAVDKRDLRVKGQTYIVTADPAIQPTRTLKLARIEYGGNWNPEPGGWPRLAGILRNKFKVDLQVTPIKLASPDALEDYAVAHITGTAALKLPDAAKAELVRFVDTGGLLIVDAAGGSKAFADSAEAELRAAFGASAASLGDMAPMDWEPYNLSAWPLREVTFRLHARSVLQGDLRSARLRKIDRGNRPGVIFSREDLSGGIVGQPVDGIVGYSPATATQLMGDLLLYAAGERKGKSATRPTTGPTTRAFNTEKDSPAKKD